MQPIIGDRMKAQKPKHFTAAKHNISLYRPRIMGVLNVTPDSFSDGGEHDSVKKAVVHAMMMLDQGADIIDVGGESTRPGFSAISIEEEIKRVLPVVDELVRRGVVVSIDTRHPEVAAVCIEHGVSILNDVEGFTNPAMIDLAARSDVGCIVMHSGLEAGSSHIQNGEDTLNKLMSVSQSQYNSCSSRDKEELFEQVSEFLIGRAHALEAAGVHKSRICIDPGAGFAKTADEDFLLHGCFARLSMLGYPTMCALSRKRMTALLSGGVNSHERDCTTAGMCIGALESGASIVRVHNVDVVRQVIDGFWIGNHPTYKKALIALGSNEGDRVGNIQQALSCIAEIPLTQIEQVSNAYDTEPAYGLETSVVDAVCEVQTALTPLLLLGKLQEIEASQGRVRTQGKENSGPRVIDLDLLWMEDEYHAGDLLQLPHSRMGERDFVITPLADIVDDPEAFMKSEHIPYVSKERRVGKVTQNLGTLTTNIKER